MSHATLKPPLGFVPRPDDYLCRGSGNSVSIAAGDLVVFDFVGATSNDPANIYDSAGASVRNGFSSVKKYDADVDHGGPGEYGVALEPITTDSSGNPVLNGMVRREGRVQVLCDATGITKGLVFMPSDATDGSVEVKPAANEASAATLEAASRVVLGQALEDKANGLGWVNFKGSAYNGAKITQP